MVTLTIDDRTYAIWSERAAACGLSVEDWLTEAAEWPACDAQGADGASSGAPAMPQDAWTARLRAFAQRRRPTGFSLDDSRESIHD